RWLLPWTDCVVTVSQQVKNRIAAQGIPPEKLHVLYNGLDTERYQPGRDNRTTLFDIPSDCPVILNIGRLAPEKGREVMLQAVRYLINRPNPPLIVFAGDGVEYPALVELAQQLNIASH